MVVIDPLQMADCFLIGTCLAPERVGPPSGLMFVAVGLVWLGLAGLVRQRAGRKRVEGTGAA